MKIDSIILLRIDLSQNYYKKSIKVIPQPVKQKIVDLLRDGLSCREVAKKIPSESGIPRIKAGCPQILIRN